MAPSGPDLIVLHEHPEWQKPLFAALERRGVSFQPFDVTRAAFSNVERPRARLYFNQASPSAYIRGHARAVPLALAYMRSLTLDGARVLNGADVFALELSKSAQATLLRTLGIDTPRSITFNDVRALHAHASEVKWPALLKPDQGGSGARIQVVESMQQVEEIFRDPSIWLPDNLFLLQEYLAHDPDEGIVRMEFLDGELLYAMRVKTHGRFNLCPSPVCRSEEHTSELQSQSNLVCRLLLEKKNTVKSFCPCGCVHSAVVSCSHPCRTGEDYSSHPSGASMTCTLPSLQPCFPYYHSSTLQFG